MDTFKKCSYLPDKYEVNIFGDVLNTKTGNIMKKQLSNSGYFYYTLVDSKKTVGRFLHRAVAFAFIDLVDGKTTVNHKDANKLNNSVDNLEWCTKSENSKHAYDLKLTVPPLNFKGKFGKFHNRSKGVRCVQTGIVYGSQLEAERKLGLGGGSICWSIKNKKPIYGMNYEHFDKELT